MSILINLVNPVKHTGGNHASFNDDPMSDHCRRHRGRC